MLLSFRPSRRLIQIQIQNHVQFIHGKPNETEIPPLLVSKARK